MADFIEFEAECEDENNEEEHLSEYSDNDSFIEDSEIIDDENYGFENVQVDIDQVLRERQERAQIRIQNFDEISNLCEDSENEDQEIDEFEKSEKVVKEFHNSLLPKVEIEQESEHNSLINAILYAIRYQIDNKTDICEIDNLKEINILKDLIDQFNQKKIEFSLDLQEFNNISYQINDILGKHNYFLRIFELKNKYKQFMLKKT